ncbi:hypothetical protein SynBMKMC1_00337 [Synechococcus sp. BMK-MC-1]|nr:hypothetical protein SynBMKMC1_00337 [Synechococcus sp. BMK-MC-1]
MHDPLPLVFFPQLLHPLLVRDLPLLELDLPPLVLDLS